MFLRYWRSRATTLPLISGVLVCSSTQCWQGRFYCIAVQYEQITEKAVCVVRSLYSTSTLVGDVTWVGPLLRGNKWGGLLTVQNRGSFKWENLLSRWKVGYNTASELYCCPPRSGPVHVETMSKLYMIHCDPSSPSAALPLLLVPKTLPSKSYLGLGRAESISREGTGTLFHPRPRTLSSACCMWTPCSDGQPPRCSDIPGSFHESLSLISSSPSTTRR